MRYKLEILRCLSKLQLTNNSDSIPRNERYIGIKLERFFVTILNALEILNDFTTSIKIKRRLLKL